MELKFKNEFAFHVLGRKCMLKKISLNASMIMNGTPYIHHHIMNTFQRKFKYSCWVCVKKLSFISCRAPKKCKSVKYTAGDLGEKQRASEEIGNWERKLDWLPPLGIFSISCRATKQGDSPTTVYIQRGERKKGPNKSVTTTGETGGGKGKSWKGSMKVRKTTKYVRVYEVRNLNCACFCIVCVLWQCIDKLSRINRQRTRWWMLALRCQCHAQDAHNYSQACCQIWSKKKARYIWLQKNRIDRIDLHLFDRIYIVPEENRVIANRTLVVGIYGIACAWVRE